MTSDVLSRPGPGLRADYVRLRPHALRWMDNDVFGHLNNVVYYSLFDSAVCEFLVGQGVLDWRGPDHYMVVAESGCHFHSELAFPDRVTVGLRVARVGERSVRYELALFREEAEVASAEGFMVHVSVAASSRRPAPMPSRWRAVLATLQAGDR